MDAGRAKHKALELLARREHSGHELRTKLVRKGCPEALANNVVSELEAARLVSDERFAETLVRVRTERGHGPLRIERELHDKGVDAELIKTVLDSSDPLWLDLVRRIRRKKFGKAAIKDYKERARQARFLQYRGFTYDQIQRALTSDESD
ncbi:MAG: regulatory protein RecX [Nitrospira sp.]|nr:regulatory protein RecX [Nitrospira sp.]